MRFGIISNEVKDSDFVFARKAASLIVSRGSIAVADESYQNTLLGTDANILISLYDSCDVIFCIGGDGTFLSAVHDHHAKDVPIVGVNLGSIGFLTEIQPEQFEDALDRFIEGRFFVENRIQLDVTVMDKDGNEKGRGLCLNDAVIARGYLLRVLTVDLFIDGDYVERLSGDGVIMSSPTGSTAYSLAAGGPIVKPELAVFLVTPICPHTLHNRSYVVAEESVVEIRLKDFAERPILSLDGRNDIELNPLDRIFVKKADRPMKIARLGYTNFYQTIRQKIRARGSFYEDGQK
jgi:NAD+ kinase